LSGLVNNGNAFEVAFVAVYGEVVSDLEMGWSDIERGVRGEA